MNFLGVVYLSIAILAVLLIVGTFVGGALTGYSLAHMTASVREDV